MSTSSNDDTYITSNKSPNNLKSTNTITEKSRLSQEDHLQVQIDGLQKAIEKYLAKQDDLNDYI